MIKSIFKYIYISVLVIMVLSISGCGKKDQEALFGEKSALLQEVNDSTNFKNTQLIRDQILNQISSGINFQTPNNPAQSKTVNNFGGTITTINDLLFYYADIQNNKSGTLHIIDINLLISSIQGGGYISIVGHIGYDDDLDTSNKVLIKIDDITDNISLSSYLKKQIFFINMAEAFAGRGRISLDDLDSNKTSILYPEKIREQLKPYITIDSNSHKIILDVDLISQDMSDNILSKLDNFDGEYENNMAQLGAGIRINNITINGKDYKGFVGHESLGLDHSNEINGDRISYGYKRFFDWIGLPGYSKHVTLNTVKGGTKTDFELNMFQEFDIQNANLNLVRTNFQYKIINGEKVDTLIIGNGIGKINPLQSKLSRPTSTKSIREILEQVEIKSREDPNP